MREITTTATPPPPFNMRRCLYALKVQAHWHRAGRFLTALLFLLSGFAAATQAQAQAVPLGLSIIVPSSVKEGEILIVTVQLERAPTEDIVVGVHPNLSLPFGTAVNEDFVDGTFSPDVSQATISPDCSPCEVVFQLPTLDDEIDEGTETLKLDAYIGAPDFPVEVAVSTLEILDNDGAVLPQLTADPQEITIPRNIPGSNTGVIEFTVDPAPTLTSALELFDSGESGFRVVDSSGVAVPGVIVNDLHVIRQATDNVTITAQSDAPPGEYYLALPPAAEALIANYQRPTVVIIDAPTANAGPAQFVNEGDDVTLDGSASADSVDSSVELIYSWTTDDDDTDVVLTGVDTAQPTFRAPDDDLTEDRVLTLTLSVADARVPAATSTATVEITVLRERLPTVHSAASGRIVEGESANFELRLEGTAFPADTPEELRTFTLDILDGEILDENVDNAVAADLAQTSVLTVVLPVGERSLRITVETVDDDIVEDLERLTLGINGTKAYVDIVDNEKYTVTFTPSSVQIAEGDEVEVVVSLDRYYRDKSGNDTLNATAELDGAGALCTDVVGYTAHVDFGTFIFDIVIKDSFASQTQKFKDGNTSVTVTLVADPNVGGDNEETETARLRLTDAAGCDSNNNKLLPNIVLADNGLPIDVINVADTTRPVVGLTASTYDVTEGATLTATLQLSRRAEGDVAVSFQPVLSSDDATYTASDSDVDTNSGHVLATFTDERCGSSYPCTEQIQIAINDDDDIEAAETFLLSFDSGEHADEGQMSVVTIEDNDKPELSTSDSVYTLTEGETVTVTVTLNRPPAQNIEVGLRKAQGQANSADFRPNLLEGALVTFTPPGADVSLNPCPSTGACKREIVIETVDDDDVEPSTENIFIGLDTNQADLVTFGNRTFRMEIEDNETLSLTQTSYTWSEGTTLVATARVGSPPTDNITVKLDFTAGSATAEDFAAGQVATDRVLVTFEPPPETGDIQDDDCPREGPCLKAITIEIADDHLVEGAESASIRLVTDQTDLVTPNPEASSLRIDDNEKLRLTEFSYPVPVDEGEEEDPLTEGETLTVTMQLVNEDGTNAVTLVPNTISVGLEFTGQSASAADFKPNQFGSLRGAFKKADCVSTCEITMTIGTFDDDDIEDRKEVALINPYSNLSGLGTATGANVTITENDFAPPLTAPIARAGPNRVAEVGMTVTLDGSQSNDPNKDRPGVGLTYDWMSDDVTLTPNKKTDEKPAGSAPTFFVSNDHAGQTLTIRLVVTDEENLVSPPSTVLITVREAGNLNFKAQVEDQTWAVGEAVNVVFPQADVPPSDESENTFDNALDYYAYTVVPALPKNVTIDRATRTLSGTPEKTAARQTYAYQSLNKINTLCSRILPFRRLAAGCTPGVRSVTTFSVAHSQEFDIVVTDGTPVVQVSVYNGPETVAEGVTVTLDGSAMDPTDQALEDPVWSSDDVSLNVPDGAKYRPTFVTPVLAQDKVLTITLAVADAGGKSATATVLVTVKANQPPTASASVIGSANVAEGVTVTLFGTVSDPAGDDLKAPVWTSNDVSLTAFDGPPEAPGPRSSFVAPVQLAVDKVLTITLTVEEAKAGGKSTQATVLVTVSAGPNDPPIVDAGPGQPRPQPGATVQLAGSASDPEDEDLTYLWTVPDDVILSNPNVLNPTFPAPTRLLGNNILTLTLTATEDLRGKSASDTLEITVVANIPPVAKAGRDETAMPGQTVTLGQAANTQQKPSATDEDQEDNTLDIAWTASGGGTLGNAGTLTPTFVVSDQIELSKELTLTLTVTDNKGATHSDTMVITVSVNMLPVVNAGANDIVAGGQTVELAGTATDPDGDKAALTYAWTTTSSDVNLSNAGTLTPTFVAPVVASDTELTLTLTATDIPGGSKSDKVTISVVAMPIVRSRTNGRIEEGEDASFDLLLPGLLYPADTPEELRTFTLEIRDAGQGNEALAGDLNTSDLTVVFPVGQQVADFDVRTNDDTTGEPLEILTLGLGASTVTATVQIADNEPHLVTFMPSPVQIAEGGQQVVDIMLDRPYYDRIAGRSLSATAAFTSDGTAEVDDTTALDIMFSSSNLASAPVTFAEGDNSAQVTLVAVPDEIGEETETAELVLSGTRVSTTGNSLDITITNTEPDQPELTLMPISTVTEGQTLTLTARLDRKPTQDIKVGMILLATSADAPAIADYVGDNPFERTLVTFTPDGCPNIEGTDDCEKEIEIGTVDDNIVEGTERAPIQLFIGTVYILDTNITSNTATIIIADNERLELSENSYSVDEGAPLTVTAQLVNPKVGSENDLSIASDIEIGLELFHSSSSAQDLQINQPDSAIFSDCPDSGPCTKTFTIATVDDTEVEGDELAVINLNSNRSGLSDAANLVIEDNDTLPADEPPIANAGSNRVVDLGVTVTLDGSRSSDPHQPRAAIGLEYEWTPPDGVTLSQESDTSAHSTFFVTDDLAGQTLTFSLEVEALTMTLANGDRRKSLEPATVTLTVRTRESYYAPFANDVEEQSWLVGVPVDLDLPLANIPDTADADNSFDNAENYYTYILAEYSPDLPAGLSFSNRKITGTPTAVAARQTYAYQALSKIEVNCSTINNPRQLRAVGCTPGKTKGVRFTVAHTLEFDIVVGVVGVEAGTGPSQPVLGGTTVSLSGTINNPGGETLNISWTGPAEVQLSGADTLTPTFVAPVQSVPNKVLTLTLTATTDPGGQSTTDTVLVTVAANTPPTVDAGTGPAQPALPLTTVSLSGTANDPEGETPIISWTGPAEVQLSGADTLTPTFVAPLQDVPNKVLTLTLTATDSLGLSATDTVLVTLAANTPPTVSAAVDAGTVMPITVGQTVTLAGTASDTENKKININLGINWVVPNDVVLSDDDELEPTFVAPALLVPDTPRTITLALIATDNRGAVGSDSVEITVYPVGYQPPPPPDNVPPVVNAGDDDVVAGGQTVALAGTATDTDGDDAMLTYAWTTTSSDVTLSADDAPATTFDAPVVASDTEITLTLTVTDEDGGSASDTVVISVVAMPTIESRTGRIEEGEDATFALRLPGLLYPTDTPAELRTFTLEILDETGVSNAESADLAPAANLTVEFPVGQGVTNFDVPTLNDTTAEPLEALALGLGTSTATVQIADNEPYSVTFSPDPVQINEGGQQVVDIMLDRPYHGRIEGSSLAATAGFDASAGTATVDDPTTRDIVFSTGDASVPVTFQEGTASDQVVQVTLVAVGDGQDDENETASLVVGGSTLLSDNALAITIGNSTLPFANAGPNQPSVPSGSQVTLDGSGSTNNDGTSPVDGYSWTRTGGTGSSSVALSSSTAAMPTFRADTLAAEDAPVTHVFSLVVTEGTAESLPATVTITVMPDPDTDLTVPIEAEQIVAARTDTLKRGVGALGSEIGSSLAGAVSARGGLATPQNRLRLSAAAGSEASGLHPSSGTDFDPTEEYGSVKDAVHGLQASQLLDKSEDGARFAGVWLQGDVNRFKDRSGEGERDGDIKSLHGGLDVRLTPQLLVGLGGSWHDGDFDYTGQGGISGKAGFEIASLYPYVNWDRDGMSAWAAVGLGSGELKVTEGDRDRTSDLDHKLAALGAAQHFEQSERIDTVLRLEAFYSNLEVDGTKAGQQALDYDGFDTEVWQLRSQGEIGWTIVEREGLHLRPYAALGLLLEDGGERGIEQEVGIDLDTADLHLRAEGRYHILDQGSRVYGYSLSADYDSGDDSRGLLFALRAQQGRQRGFEDFDTNSSLRESQGADGRRTEAELGYGLLLSRGGMLKPYLVRRFASERNSSEFGLDYRLRALQMRLGYEQTRPDSDQSEDNRFSIKAKLEF